MMRGMKTIIPVMCVLVLGATVAASQPQKDEVTFPTKDEIQLLLTQTDRAMQQYKPVVEQEAALDKAGADAAEKDRQVIHAIDMAVTSLKKNPEGFNSPAGFFLFE
jgi:hypothetical protein